MNERHRPTVAILSMERTMQDTLREWLQAAGYEPVVAATPPPGTSVTVATWPLGEGQSLPTGPLVVLVERGSLDRPTPRATVHVIERPDQSCIQSLLGWSARFSEALRQLSALPPTNAARPAVAQPALPVAVPQTQTASNLPTLIAIGISTGGPEALQVFLATLTGSDLPPIVIVQHIPDNFVGDLAHRLQQRSGLEVQVAREGTLLRRNTVTLAPGDRHLRLRRESGRFHAVLTDEPARRGHRPAADVLFESCCDLGVHGIGVIMTGMGRDGADGLLLLRNKRWRTIGQDEASSTIYGMPRAAYECGAVEVQLPVSEIGPRIRSLCFERQPARSR